MKVTTEYTPTTKVYIKAWSREFPKLYYVLTHIGKHNNFCGELLFVEGSIETWFNLGDTLEEDIKLSKKITKAMSDYDDIKLEATRDFTIEDALSFDWNKMNDILKPLTWQFEDGLDMFICAIHFFLEGYFKEPSCSRNYYGRLNCLIAQSFGAKASEDINEAIKCLLDSLNDFDTAIILMFLSQFYIMKSITYVD